MYKNAHEEMTPTLAAILIPTQQKLYGRTESFVLENR